MTGKRTQDRVLGAVIFLVAAAFFTQTMELSAMAALLPRIALGGMMIAGVLIICVPGHSANTDGYITGKEMFRELIVPAAILFGCGMLFRVLGFYICSFLIMALLGFYEEYLENGRLQRPTVCRSLLRALAVSGLLYVVFAVFLRLPTPEGILGF